MNYQAEPATDEGKCLGTLMTAFVADPLVRWMYPTAREYLTHFPGFIKGLAGPTFERKAAWSIADHAAVALWLPPGAGSDEEAIGKHVMMTVAQERLEDLGAIVEQMGRYHPTFDHWYLPWLGVDASAQGKGLGGQLLKQCLATVDADGLPAYLESPNPRNVPFYERHGFEAIGVSQTRSAPPLTFMLRQPR